MNGKRVKQLRKQFRELSDSEMKKYVSYSFHTNTLSSSKNLFRNYKKAYVRNEVI